MFSTKHPDYNTFPDPTPTSLHQNSGTEEDKEEEDGSGKYRNVFSFWFLGLCTDFGYWIILTAAHDLLSRGESAATPVVVSTAAAARECNQVSAGVILIVNIVPNFVMKSFLPFLPLWIHARVFVAIILSVAGFSIAACNQINTNVLSGVGLCSVAVGIWTSSFLMYLPSFDDEKVVKAWCSGCGASGFLASTTYVVLTTRGVGLSTILSCMMGVPPLMALVFWFVMDHPETYTVRLEERYYDSGSRKRFAETFYGVLKLICLFTTPYLLVFFCQYLINQGLFELVYIKNSFMDLSTQVRWLTFVYLLAVLVASSFVVIKVDRLWLLVFLQATNLGIMSTESIFGWLGHSSYVFWVIVALVFWEGIIAGVSYVNTYRRINEEIAENLRQFSMSINSVGASMGMTLAGFIAIPLHNYICNLPLP